MFCVYAMNLELYDPLAQPNGPVGSPTSSSPGEEIALYKVTQSHFLTHADNQ